MLRRDYKAESSILEFARKLEVEDRKKYEFEDEQAEAAGKEGNMRTSLLQANWVTEGIWNGMRDRIMVQRLS